MKIIENSVEDISPVFSRFTALIQGINYTVWMKAIAFSFEGEPRCNESDLKSVVPGGIINRRNSLSEISCEVAQKTINRYLNYAGGERGVYMLEGLDQDVPNKLWEKRKAEFAPLLNSCIPVPTLKCYDRFPALFGYWGEYLIWGECFIFLSSSQGLLFEMGATD